MSEQETPKKSNGGFIIIILFLLVGLGILSFLYSKKNTALNNCTNENTALKADMNGMNEMMSGYVGNLSNDLTKDFQNMLHTYDELIKKDKSKADSLNLQKDKILGLMNDLEQAKKSGKLDARKIAELTRRNEALVRIMRGYVVQIDSLNTLNVKLNSELNKTTSKLETTLTERDQYKKEAELKTEQVRKGSKLQAFNFHSTGLKMKLNNTTDETNKARNCVQIQSTFTLSENPLNQAGNKVIYMQVVDPNGKVLQAKPNYFTEVETGSIAYSDKKEVNYQNKQLDLSIYYSFGNNEAQKGNYKINIYADGSLIGSDNFVLK